jgi:type IV pilus assembly protein PilB
MAASMQPRLLSGLPRRLVQEGIINESVAAEAEAESQKSATSSVVTYLVEKNLADARDVAGAACHEFGVPLMDLDAIEIDLDTARLIDDKLMHRHRVVPLFRRGRRLFVGVSDPTRLQAIDEIKFATGLGVEAIVVEDNKLDAMLVKLAEALDTTFDNLGGEDLDLENVDVSNEDQSGADLGRDEIDDAPIVRFVNKILLDAINKGASDIHFEPYEKYYRVRTRLDGVLKEITRPPIALAYKVTARIKVMARMDIAERRIPQDGRIKLKLSAKRAIDFRVNTLPTLYGEKVVMRILDASQAKLGIDALGYEDFQRQLYLDALSKPYGMILVTGPTGSGKTVSLYTGLNILNTEDRNISTAEDPAEINLPGVNQVNVNPKVGLTFASALRAFLRQDPDIIMVGEIRDLETAEIAIKAAQTGHMVLSTLHTNDAPKTLTRLVDMGVAPYAIASSVTLIIAQRLARKLCGNCKEPREIPREALLREGFSEAEVEDGLTIYGPVGCSKCNDGYKGRAGIFQVMPVSENIGRIIMEGGNAMQIAAEADKEGIWDLRRSALFKVKNGVTSLEEVNRVTID